MTKLSGVFPESFFSPFSVTALRHTLALINCQCYYLAGNKRRQGDRMLSAICEHCKSGCWRTLCALSPRISQVLWEPCTRVWPGHPYNMIYIPPTSSPGDSVPLFEGLRLVLRRYDVDTLLLGKEPLCLPVIWDQRVVAQLHPHIGLGGEDGVRLEFT